MKKALMPHSGIGVKALLKTTKDAVEGLTGNANFPTPTPALADLQTAYNTLDASSAKATYGTRQEKATGRADRLALLQLVRRLVTYVNFEADGDEQKLAGCGLPLSKTRQPSVLGTAQPSLAYEGTSGELTLATPAVDGAIGYKHQYTTDADNGPWLEVVTSRSKCKLVNLLPGTTYISRIVTIGTGGRQTVSEVVTRKAG